MHKNSFPPNDKFKRNLGIIWVLFIAVCVTLYFIYARQLTPENISDFVKNYQGGVLLLYFALCTIRGITMIPGTPFLLAGILLFKDSPFLLLAVFLASMLVTSALMFYLADKLGFSSYFEKNYPEKIVLVREKLDGRNGFLFIMLWAFAPFTPTDLVCYVAGSVRMRFLNLIVPLLAGEAIICAFYIFNGQILLEKWAI
ncbi:VTT domain-containing protein [Daejeonella sp.]|uniref:VTT domain-containing protein n=1 Tax=Daejeonella sp. TaxID=2805397 RepID=UPI0030BFAAB6